MPEHEIETIFRDEDRNWEQPVSGIYYYAVPYGRTTGVFRNWKYATFCLLFAPCEDAAVTNLNDEICIERQKQRPRNSLQRVIRNSTPSTKRNASLPSGKMRMRMYGDERLGRDWTRD